MGTEWRNKNSKKWRKSYKPLGQPETLQYSITGVPEEDEQRQEIENVSEQIMKENFPELAKETDFQGVQEAQRVPQKLDPRKHTPKHILVIILPKIKNKERILKAAREKETVTHKGISITINWFHRRNITGKKGLERSIPSHERQGPTSKMTVSRKVIIRMEGQIKCFPDKVKLEEFIITKPSLYEMLKGLI